jgi:hypothetical protein
MTGEVREEDEAEVGRAASDSERPSIAHEIFVIIRTLIPELGENPGTQAKSGVLDDVAGAHTRMFWGT